MRNLILMLILCFSISTTAQQKIPYSKLEKWDLKKYKETGNWVAVGFMYIDHGNVEEGAALVRQEIAKGKCVDGCEYKLQEAINESRFPKETIWAFNRAVYRLREPDSVKSSMVVLRTYDARGDFPRATAIIARCFEDGTINPPNIEIDSAIFYYQKAAMLGYVPSMFHLGELYQYADGNTNHRASAKYAQMLNSNKARYWYNEAAKNGIVKGVEKTEAWNIADSLDAYKKGEEAYEAGNFAEAHRLWNASALAEQNALAFFRIGALYYMGKIPGRNFVDYVNAEEWFKGAGDLGYAKGYFWKAKLLWEYEGFGSTAMDFYQMAADLGLKEALVEKQKIQDYANAVIANRQKPSLDEIEKLKNIWGDEKEEKNSNNRRLNPFKGKSNPHSSTCSSCGGSGTSHTTIPGGAKGPGGSTIFGEYRTCTACNGRGFY